MANPKINVCLAANNLNKDVINTHTRPVYTKIQTRLQFKWSYFSHRPEAVLFINVIFVDMGYWRVWAAILVVFRRFENRTLHYARLRFLSSREHFFPHCFGTFSISSFPNNLKIISTWIPGKWRTLVLGSRNASLALNFPTLCQDNTKRNTETDTTAARDRTTYMCHRKPRTGHIPEWKTQKMSRKIYEFFFFVC